MMAEAVRLRHAKLNRISTSGEAMAVPPPDRCAASSPRCLAQAAGDRCAGWRIAPCQTVIDNGVANCIVALMANKIKSQFNLILSYAEACVIPSVERLSLIHISEPTRH